MALRQNVSTADRIVRGVAGIWLLAMAVGAALDPRGTVAAITGIAGLGLLSNSLTGHCAATRCWASTPPPASRDGEFGT